MEKERSVPDFTDQQLEFFDEATDKIFSDTVFAMNEDWRALMANYQEIEPFGNISQYKVSLIDKALKAGFSTEDFENVKAEIKSRLIQDIEGYISKNEEKRADYKHMENIAIVLVEERFTLPEQQKNKNTTTTSTES